MAFTSLRFIFLFLPACFLLAALCPLRWRRYVLLLESLAFCAFAGWQAVAALLGAGCVNYLLLLSKRRLCQIAAVVLDVAAMVLCKVFGILPLGCSFYLFQLIGIQLARFRGGARPGVRDFALELLFFPKLAQGPILRAGALAEQEGRIAFPGRGLRLFVLGLCCKVLLADKLSLLWAQVGTIGVESISTPMAWLALAGFCIQLFLDFQGYCLMALGVAGLLGYELPENFLGPFGAKSISSFYRRWHRTLGLWFRDYVYIPLGGSRCPPAQTACNLLIVWLLTGLWHGLRWHYLAWGLFTGVLIVLEHRFYGKKLESLPVLGHFYVLFLIPMSFVLFSGVNAGAFFGRLFGLTPQAVAFSGDFLKYLGEFWPYLLAGALFCIPAVEKWLKRSENNLLQTLLLAVCFWLCVRQIRLVGANPFQYLQF